MVICLERRADLHMALLMPLPLTISCFSKIQIGFTFLVPAHLGNPGKRAVKWVCKRVCVCHHALSVYSLSYWFVTNLSEHASVMEHDVMWKAVVSHRDAAIIF